MPNEKDIDDILDSMFRNGRLNFKGKDHGGIDAAETARKEIDSFKEAQALNREAKESLGDLERNLRQDGFTPSTINSGADKDIENAFSKAEEEVKKEIIGQDDFISKLSMALRRPIILKEQDRAHKIVLSGRRGTGRRTALKLFLESLFRAGVLASPKLSEIDLSKYRQPGEKKLFLQDLYTSLDVPAICFTGIEEADLGVRDSVSQLFKDGRCQLPGRYKEQKGILTEVGSAFAANAVSQLSASGKYIILISEKDREKLAEELGSGFAGAVDDFCATSDFSPEALLKIAEKTLSDLLGRCEKKLGFSGTYDEKAVSAVTSAFSKSDGVPSMQIKSNALFSSMGDEKLSLGLKNWRGMISADGEELICIYGDDKKLIRTRPPVGEEERNAALENVKAELQNLVGLYEIKDYVLSIEQNYLIQKMRGERGLKIGTLSMHMIFTGNPGTGKTTVARLVARLLKAIGAISGGQLVEVSRADLVGKYVGHTAPQTRQAIESALGGVLFIDEAYSLYRGEDDSFGLEAIDTLVKGMEDYRENLVVILAGYTYEMEEFLNANSGLRSRFPNIIEFPDYTGEELYRISENIALGEGYRLSSDCAEPLTAYFAKLQREGDPRTNGNGRLARNKVEEAILNSSRRNLALPESERNLELLLPSDFELG